MKVEMVWVTPNAENLVAKMARVSNPENQNNPSIARLIKSCIDRKEWSIFEMVNLCMEIETSRAISAQILRHKSFSFQEFSQRYAKVQTFEPVEPRKQHPNNRQSSTDNLPEDIKKEFITRLDDLEDILTEFYEWSLANGVAKECARFALPMCVQTRMYVNGTLRSWIHYIQVRTDEVLIAEQRPGTQLEHRLIAESVKSIFCDQFPTISEALGWQ